MYNKDKTVIVYLAMNTAKDESYGRDSRTMLETSLDSLYMNYNNEFMSQSVKPTSNLTKKIICKKKH